VTLRAEIVWTNLCTKRQANLPALVRLNVKGTAKSFNTIQPNTCDKQAMPNMAAVHTLLGSIRKPFGVNTINAVHTKKPR